MRELIAALLLLIPLRAGAVDCRDLAFDGASFTVCEVAAEEDLRLFLADRPVKARRASWREQGWRWCRRNPGVAASLSIAVVLCTLAFMITFVPLIPFCWLMERWRARNYYLDLAPVKQQRRMIL